MIKHREQIRTEVREKMRGGAGAVTLRHYFDGAEFGAKVRLCAQLVLPPGAGIGPHQHAGEDEVYLITRGSGLLHDGKTETRVSAGDAILTGKGESHAIRNDGTEPLEITAVIVCYT